VKVHTAQLAAGSRNADRVFVTADAVVVLDGASAFAPTDTDPATYAQTLGEHIASRLDTESTAELSHVVVAAIRATATQLHLAAGHSPSSTVSILRTRDGAADLYVLGDSPIYYGTAGTINVLTRSDWRLSLVPSASTTRAACAPGTATRRTTTPLSQRSSVASTGRATSPPATGSLRPIPTPLATA
jgi:hypothetical protein